MNEIKKSIIEEILDGDYSPEIYQEDIKENSTVQWILTSIEFKMLHSKKNKNQSENDLLKQTYEYLLSDERVSKREIAEYLGISPDGVKKTIKRIGVNMENRDGCEVAEAEIVGAPKKTDVDIMADDENWESARLEAMFQGKALRLGTWFLEDIFPHLNVSNIDEAKKFITKGMVYYTKDRSIFREENDFLKAENNDSINIIDGLILFIQVHVYKVSLDDYDFNDVCKYLRAVEHLISVGWKVTEECIEDLQGYFLLRKKMENEGISTETMKEIARQIIEDRTDQRTPPRAVPVN